MSQISNAHENWHTQNTSNIPRASSEGFALTAALQGGEYLLLLPRFADDENQFISKAVFKCRLFSSGENSILVVVN